MKNGEQKWHKLPSRALIGRVVISIMILFLLGYYLAKYTS